ncbi:MAG: GAF domain-containing sensor histidine kinase [Actinomycetota bacterium]|nr:GAF domain-containing sensor histidine kinase [Actinomycetota bacterium]
MTAPQADVLRRLLDVALAVAGERRTEPVLRTVLDAARDLAGARYAAVGVPDGGGGMALFLTAGIDEQTWDDIGYLPTRHGLLGVLLEEPTALRLADIRQEPRFTGWPAGHPDMSSFLGVPILAGGEILAELYLADKVGAPAFTDADQRLVETLAAHAALAIVNAQRLERARELSMAQERTRLARDLHDSVTQTLFSLALSAESAATIAGAADADLAGELDRVRLLSGAALTELRSLVDTLRAPDGEHEGLVVALRQRVALLQRVHDVPVELTIHGEVAKSTGCSRTVDRELLRIAHEAMANALQHAGAGAVQVSLSGGPDLRLVVADDGAGFDFEETVRTSRRMGLTSMRERAEALGGRLDVRTAPGQGTTVTVEVPAG